MTLINRIQDKIHPTLFPVLVFVNKRDKPGSMTAEEVEKIFRLEEVRNNSNAFVWHYQECCAVKGEGISEGFDFLRECFINN